jgi:hypothetical protein
MRIRRMQRWVAFATLTLSFLDWEPWSGPKKRR